MKTYIFNTLDSSTQRGCNVTVQVYRVKGNKPSFIGCSHHHTATWFGAQAQACQVIAKEDGHKLRDSYSLAAKDIQVLAL